MKPSMASPLLPSTIIIFSILLSTSAAAHGTFSAELFHRDSSKSPYYNPAATPFDRLQAASQRTVSRAAHFRRSISTNGSFHSAVIPDRSDFEYLMTLSLGTPPTKLLFIADTGSDTVWTQCMGCKRCFKLTTPPFDPAKSSTYEHVPCKSAYCTEDNGCTSNDACIYSLSYGDGSYSSGILSYETFTFNSNEVNSSVSFPKMVFGCSSTAGGHFSTRAVGIAGLGHGPPSLITQLKSTIDGKFSYCLVPFTNLSATGVMRFGNGAVVGGRDTVSTPLILGRDPIFYWVTLKHIVIGNGEHKIEVNPSDDGSREEGNMIVDSGTSLTILDDSTIEDLESKLSSLIKLPPVKAENKFRLCFNATRMSASDLPEMTFMFTGAAVKLKPLNTFVEASKGVVCLAMLPSGGSGWSIYGNIAQQNFQVGYDLEAKLLSFTPADCPNN